MENQSVNKDFDFSKVQDKDMISTDHNGKIVILNPQNPDKIPNQFFPIKNDMTYQIEKNDKFY